MAKSLLHRLFGFGTIPKALREELDSEGILVWDEGLQMSIHYARYRAPGQLANGRRGFAGYVALTRERLVAKGYSIYYSSVPLSEVNAGNLSYGLRGADCFWFSYEASDFYEDRSGGIETRLRTPRAQELVERLDELLGRG